MADVGIRAGSLLLMSLAATLSAPASLLAGDRVKVTVVTILATTSNDKVDPRLQCLAREVRKKEPDLRGFQIKRMEHESLAVGKKYTFKLIDGQSAIVVVEHGANKSNRVRLMVKAPLQGELVYITVCGKFLPIVTGFKSKKKGERLILAVMVKPCRGK